VRGLKKRLLIVTEIIAPYRIPIFNALAAREDVDLHVIFLSETDPSLRQWEVYRDEIRFSFEVLKSYRRRVGGFNLLVTRGVERALRSAQPQVILCGGYNYLASWQALRWAKGNEVSLLLWSESNAADARSHFWPVEAAKRRFVQSCRGYVVPGASSAEYLRSLGAADQRIFIARNAVDVERFAAIAERARATTERRGQPQLPGRYLLNVGRFVVEKGIFDLLDAYATLPQDLREAVGLVLVGDGPERQELARRSRGITPGNVVFTGFLQRDELAEIYGLAEALVFPTHSDPWGLVVNEAMACGLPVIATDVAGCVADLVRDRGNGFVVQPKCPGQLREAMECLLRDSVMRERMAQESARMINSFTPEIWARGVANAISQDWGNSRG
jgi:glycosyltransferase involved in cell wall biosynthesis